MPDWRPRLADAKAPLDFLLIFSTPPLPFVAALAGVTIGIATSAVAYMASVKSLIADLLMRLS